MKLAALAFASFTACHAASDPMSGGGDDTSAPDGGANPDGADTPDGPPPPYVMPNITLDAAQTFQTFGGWEATISTHAPFMRQEQYDNLVDDAIAFGITAVRIDAPPGEIESADGLTWVNDNASPTSTNAAGFLWNGTIDARIQRYVLRFAEKVAANNERFLLRISISGDEVHGAQGMWTSAPAEYAEFVSTVVAHVQTTYGLHVDFLDARNEPEVGTLAKLTGTQLGQRIAAAGPVLAAAGFTGKISAPSTTNAANAAPYWTSGARRRSMTSSPTSRAPTSRPGRSSLSTVR